MPKFERSVCGQSFEVPRAALNKYPGWEPRHCREHSPNRKKKTAKRATAPRRESSARRDENLTLEQVLAQYSGGPETGVFTGGGSMPNPGPGGWGMAWVENGEIRSQAHRHDPDTTNNRMELTALIAAPSCPSGSSVLSDVDRFPDTARSDQGPRECWSRPGRLSFKTPRLSLVRFWSIAARSSIAQSKTEGFTSAS